ncbi:hypothetical protein KCP69_01805 [Salmonella enterica subsp. enterica]|nr:hypothetical protein KCP69_01805 [Salmonella enterica subsp. enterica]
MKKTGGDIQVQYFPDGQRRRRELVELTQVGVVVAGCWDGVFAWCGVFSPYHLRGLNTTA